MHARTQILIILGTLVACGGDDQASATTMTSLTTVSATMMTSLDPSGDTTAGDSSDGTAPTGPANPTDESGTPDTSDGSTEPPAPGAPIFLSLQTNVAKITAGESVIFTAVLTDPDGVDDIVGGTLSDTTGMIGYGPFVAAGEDGTYSISLSWDAVHQAEPIEFEGMDLIRVFRAEFYDQAANKVSKDVNLTLMCAEGSACDGVCTDIMANVDNCGGCGAACEGGCMDGKCAPKWSECIVEVDGFATCDQYCTSVAEVCVENGCGPGATVLGYDAEMFCPDPNFDQSFLEPCDKVQTYDSGRHVIQCCCTDTP